MDDIEEEDEVDDSNGDGGNSDKDQEGSTDSRHERVRKLIGEDYLLTEAELTLELDSDEEFEAQNRGGGVFAALLDDI